MAVMVRIKVVMMMMVILMVMMVVFYFDNGGGDDDSDGAISIGPYGIYPNTKHDTVSTYPRHELPALFNQ